MYCRKRGTQMDKALLHYRSQVIRAMKCPRKVKRTLLPNLDALLESFQQEEPGADRARILKCFGSPARLAETLCGEYSERQRAGWCRNRRIRIGVGALLCACLIAFVAYEVAIQSSPAPVYVIDELYIEDESDLSPD